MNNCLGHTNEMYHIVKAMLVRVEKNLAELDDSEINEIKIYFRGQKTAFEILLTAMKGDKDYLMEVYELTEDDIYPLMEG